MYHRRLSLIASPRTVLCLPAGLLHLAEQGFRDLLLPRTHGPVCDKLAYTLRRLPGIGMLLYVPCITWGFLIILCLLVYKFSLSAIVPWSFFIATFGICLLSPKSGEIRYLIPVLYVLPLIVCTMLTRKDRSLQ